MTNPKTDTPLSITARGIDRTQEMLEHMTRVQLREQIFAGVIQSQLVEFADIYTSVQRERGAGCLDEIDTALRCSSSHLAIATAMPRVKLHHRGNDTVH